MIQTTGFEDMCMRVTARQIGKLATAATVQRYILARTSATANRSLICGCIR